MLKDLGIKNIAVIKDISLSFKEGLTLLTGETGAGKSIIVDSLNLILGQRAYSDVIRTKEKEAVIEGVFNTAGQKEVNRKLEELDLDNDQEDLILRRKITRDSRNKVYINDSRTTLRSMNCVGRKLVDIHGQHQHQSLLDPENHRKFLDVYGNNEELVSQIEKLFEKISRVKERLDSLKMDEQEKARKKDMLEFQIEEIENAGFEKGDEEKLRSERNILANAQEYRSLLDEANEMLSESDRNILTMLSRLIKTMNRLAEMDSSFDSEIENVEDAMYSLEDMQYFFQDKLEEADYSPERLEEVENRLSLLDRLEKKYGPTLEDVLSFKRDARRELDEITKNDDKINTLEERLKELYHSYSEKAAALSEKRKETAVRLKEAMEKELSELAMSGAKFEPEIDFELSEESPVEIDGKPVSFNSRGYDRVKFLFSPNVGEELRDLTKIASGGEISRIMLALKSLTVDSNSDSEKTLIFDEIDSGIGGKEAEVVAEKLKSLSNKHQVICVTHLPQIASFADHHYLITKEESEGRTYTGVNRVEGSERIEELARMLDGREISGTAVQHAKDLITRAEEEI